MALTIVFAFLLLLPFLTTSFDLQNMQRIYISPKDNGLEVIYESFVN